MLIYKSDFVILAKFQTYDFHVSGLLGRLLATPSSFQTFTFWRADSRLTEFMTYKQACHVFMLAYWFHLYEQSLPMPIMGLIANKIVGKTLKPPSTSPAPNHAKTWAERVNGKFATFLRRLSEVTFHTWEHNYLVLTAGTILLDESYTPRNLLKK